MLVTGNAKAKYDKKKRSLRIVIPIDQTVKYEQDEVESAQITEITDEQKPNVVENDAWKNKVLEFSEANISEKILKQEENV